MELDDMTPRIREMALNVDECGGFLNGLWPSGIPVDGHALFLQNYGSCSIHGVDGLHPPFFKCREKRWKKQP